MRKTVLLKSLIIAVAGLLLFAVAFKLAMPPRTPSPRVGMTKEEVLTEIVAVGTEHELRHGFDDRNPGHTLFYLHPQGFGPVKRVYVHFSDDGKVTTWEVQQNAINWQNEFNALIGR
jgi:hypothetical protein